MKNTNRCPVVLLMLLLLLPGTCHRGDAWLHHHRLSGVNGMLKLRNHLSILLSTFFCNDCPPTPLCFSFVLVTPPPPVTLYFAFYLPIIGNPFIKYHTNKSVSGGGLRWIYCFKSSCERLSRFIALDISTAFSLTSIRIWGGVSKFAFYDGAFQRERKEIQSFFSI